MRNKVIAALVAGGLLVGAGFVTAIVSSPGTASAQEQAEEGEEKGFFARGLEALSSVLDEMVGNGEIDQDTADAVLSNVEEAAEAAKAEREAIREAVEAAFEDGSATQQELEDAGLPEDHWLFTSEALEEAWADGSLTQEELREAKPHPRRDAFKRGARFGALLDDGGIDQAEFDGLDDDHPLKQIDGIEDYLDDGVITIDELRELREANRPSDTDTSA